jgi:hypothetical protein
MSTCGPVPVPAECPTCRSARVARLVNGQQGFSPELVRALNDGRAIFGGPPAPQDSPAWQCVTCGHRWGRIEPLKTVGFWRPNADWDDWRSPCELPDPRWLVRRGWLSRQRRRILAYLRSGYRFEGYAGPSYCRFWLCQAWPRRLGNWDLTDGQWVWPEGLAHYVEKHGVCLPDEFADTMRSSSWQVRPLEELALAQVRGQPYDLSFWVAWSDRQKKRPWWFMYW